ncbi:hypothetical protein Bca4012_030238 [Brassica carinata]|uniref:BnaC04g15870D protein n=3 Tax=Brassica TaxID=3705 RepID=A0A078FSB9_BRANA|nr:PREDICTED: double-stranded RNA-binding protein 2 [Brassica oleracea var. oleracea]XP_013692153.1 double-stranded RNA-binding protein 2-like [Brassica napus]KAH0883697.1 hypothetical protein HID58_059793 [Brassica napus]CAF1831931.1 unnamed protein product [Brassica napus]CDY15737.1 BnaC04g15870D [Brassica napus]
MYKNQLQELAQRSCFNLPSYTCIREGPDHAPRFKATVNFNGEIFESPQYCSTLRQAEHSAAEVALGALSNRGPSHSLAARILDETGVYKNLLQEIAQRVGAPLPRYTTFRSGLGHQPVFTGTVELAGITFTGDQAKNKKQAEKNAAMAAWSSLKLLAKETSSTMPESENIDELEQVIIARALINYRIKENIGSGSSSSAPVPFAKRFFMQSPRPTSPQPGRAATSRILPFICPQPSSRSRSVERAIASALENRHYRPQQRFATPGTAPPYVSVRHLGSPCHRGMAPPVTIRTSVPVFSAPPPRLPPPSANTQQQQQQLPSVYVPSIMRAAPVRIAPPVTIRTAAPVFASVRKEEGPLPVRKVNIQNPPKSMTKVEETKVQEKEERTTLVLPDSLEIEEEGSAKPVSKSAKETERAEVKGEEETARERLENLKI